MINHELFVRNNLDSFSLHIVMEEQIGCYLIINYEFEMTK